MYDRVATRDSVIFAVVARQPQPPRSPPPPRSEWPWRQSSIATTL